MSPSSSDTPNQYIEYAPSIAGNSAYLAIFAVLLSFQGLLGLYYRTWGFWAWMVSGLILEILGYAGRLLLHNNAYSLNDFLLYFIPLGLGPAFMTAAIYLTLGRIVVVYGEKYSRFMPRTYTLVFVTIDWTSLVIQAVGGSLTASATTDSARQTGTDILIAGLALQAGSLAGFLSLCLEFARNVRRGNLADRNPECDFLRNAPRFKRFLAAVAVAAIFIFVRCIYRIVELTGGFSGSLANNEPSFMVLEGPMIMIAVIALTIAHPGFTFRGGYWKASSFPIFVRRSTAKSHAAKNELQETTSDSSI